MAKSINEVMGGIFCCIEPEKPWCNDCPYEKMYDCKNKLRNDISYWVALGKMELGTDGLWQPVGSENIPKRKNKRKNGRRFMDGERRNQRQYDEE